MLRVLLVLFIVVPLVDLYVLFQIGDLVGLWPTVALVVATGATGAWLAKHEGLRVLRRWHDALLRGRMPEEGVLSGVLVLVGGALLITPGVITDVMGLFLLVPPTRRLVAKILRRAIERRLASGTLRVVSFSRGGPGAGFPDERVGVAAPRPVMDVEAEVIEPGSGKAGGTTTSAPASDEG